MRTSLFAALASDTALLTATLDLTGNGFSNDDLIAEELELSQGDLELELVLRAQGAGTR